jgi:GAF domain-containing protein
MKISPLPENEEKRLETIQSFHILDTEDEDDFDGIVELASQLCDAPIALITLIDRNRQWFKAKTGSDTKFQV